MSREGVREAIEDGRLSDETDKTVSVGQNPTKVLDGNPNRVSYRIQNVGSSKVTVARRNPEVGTNEGLVLDADESTRLHFRETGAGASVFDEVYAINHGTGTNDIRVRAVEAG